MSRSQVDEQLAKLIEEHVGLGGSQIATKARFDHIAGRIPVQDVHRLVFRAIPLRTLSSAYMMLIQHFETKFARTTTGHGRIWFPYWLVT
jgi:hypothetical protein